MAMIVHAVGITHGPVAIARAVITATADDDIAIGVGTVSIATAAIIMAQSAHHVVAVHGEMVHVVTAFAAIMETTAEAIAATHVVVSATHVASVATEMPAAVSAGLCCRRSCQCDCQC